MNDNAEVVAVAGEAARHVDAHALLDVMQDLLDAGLVTDEEQAQAIVAHHLERFALHVGLGVAGPSHAEPAELAGDGLRARRIVGKRVVVEENLLHFGKSGFSPRHLLDDVADASRAVASPADGLRPQAEGAARLAASSCVEGEVGMLEIADKVFSYVEVAS